MPTTKKAKRLAELAGAGQAFEGEKVPLVSIEGKDVKLIDFRFATSTYQEGQEYTTMQLEIDGVLTVVSTGAQVLCERFHNIDKERMLPGDVRFVKRKSAAGRDYWDME